MAFRTVVIEKALKINLDLNNIVVYYKEEKFWINLDEISVILIEDPRCYVTLKLLTELCEKGITMIFCDSSHMPIGSLNTLFNNSRSSKKIFKQTNWDQKTKQFLWTEIVKKKIENQIKTLKSIEKTEKINILERYIDELQINDLTNREGLASRVYFKELFGENFKRFSEDLINFSINYIYQVIRAKISQEIVNLGYNPSLGIFHRSEYNCYNLADDFIEVYRPIVDYYVKKIIDDYDYYYLTSDFKLRLANIMNERVNISSNSQKIHRSIYIFLQNMFSFLETGDISKIEFPEII